MTSAEIEASARIVEAELRKIREAFGMREVSATSVEFEPYWYMADRDGNTGLKRTPGECISLVLVKQRQAAK